MAQATRFLRNLLFAGPALANKCVTGAKNVLFHVIMTNEYLKERVVRRVPQELRQSIVEGYQALRETSVMGAPDLDNKG